MQLKKVVRMLKVFCAVGAKWWEGIRSFFKSDMSPPASDVPVVQAHDLMQQADSGFFNGLRSCKLISFSIFSKLRNRVPCRHVLPRRHGMCGAWTTSI